MNRVDSEFDRDLSSFPTYVLLLIFLSLSEILVSIQKQGSRVADTRSPLSGLHESYRHRYTL